MIASFRRCAEPVAGDSGGQQWDVMRRRCAEQGTRAGIGREEGMVRPSTAGGRPTGRVAQATREQATRVVAAMEATGTYWKPLEWFLRQAGYTVVLINTYHVKQGKEHSDNTPSKNDRKDCRIRRPSERPRPGDVGIVLTIRRRLGRSSLPGVPGNRWATKKECLLMPRRSVYALRSPPRRPDGGVLAAAGPDRDDVERGNFGMGGQAHQVGLGGRAGTSHRAVRRAAARWPRGAGG